MDDLRSQNLAEWIFPDFEEKTFSEEEVLLQSEQELRVLQKEEELDKLKEEYHRKLALMVSLIGKIEKPFSEVDKEIIELINTIINKTVKKIIQKEFQADANLIKKIIKEMCGLVHDKNTLLTIYVSEVDFHRINDEEILPSLDLKLAEDLSEGDVIVKSNFCEVRAILNDRINKLIGIK